MKKLKTLFIFLGIFFLTLPFSFCSAWSNGSYAYDYVQYDYNTDYGTHDWIAEGALDALMAYDGANWGWLNDANRKKIYLVGTEAPDNSGVSMVLDGVEETGFGDTPKHHVYILGVSTNVTSNDAALRAKTCGEIADAAISANKLDKAAFYLGAMTHYIADLSMYAHCVPNNVWPDYIDFDTYHSTVESRVLTRTNDHDNREEFFKMNPSVSIGNKAPYDVAIELAWETYKDPTPESTTRNAVWLHNNFFSTWASNFAERSSDTTTHQLYYDRIEECLNNAIAACATAMVNIGGVPSTLPSYPLPLLGFIFGISILGLIILETKRNKFSKI